MLRRWTSLFSLPITPRWRALHACIDRLRRRSSSREDMMEDDDKGQGKVIRLKFQIYYWGLCVNSMLGFQVFVLIKRWRALNAGFVGDARSSLREHAGVWVMTLENEIEDIGGLLCPLPSRFNQCGPSKEKPIIEVRNEHLHVGIEKFLLKDNSR